MTLHVCCSDPSGESSLRGRGSARMLSGGAGLAAHALWSSLYPRWWALPGPWFPGLPLRELCGPGLGVFTSFSPVESFLTLVNREVTSRCIQGPKCRDVEMLSSASGRSRRLSFGTKLLCGTLCLRGPLRGNRCPGGPSRPLAAGGRAAAFL